ncbi:hypothetical protein FNV43_RR05404 [Rhamnella rubrinervis]|uniref:Uncharacterized protein n=1 Tax=Rhamnella rubrinervis TaxID=2594499 RepID=A0A8K0MQF2_9ROSA|nr:hypothetical protein FNV43_RR05404 [Rhamnella rubrinervis]
MLNGATSHTQYDDDRAVAHLDSRFKHLKEHLEQQFEERLVAFSQEMRATLEDFLCNLNLPPPSPLHPRNHDGDLPPPRLMNYPQPQPHQFQVLNSPQPNPNLNLAPVAANNRPQQHRAQAWEADHDPPPSTPPSFIRPSTPPTPPFRPSTLLNHLRSTQIPTYTPICPSFNHFFFLFDWEWCEKQMELVLLGKRKITMAMRKGSAHDAKLEE